MDTERLPKLTVKILPDQRNGVAFGSPVILLVDDTGTPRARLMGIMEAHLTMGQDLFARASVDFALFEWERGGIVVNRREPEDAIPEGADVWDPFGPGDENALPQPEEDSVARMELVDTDFENALPHPEEET